MDAVITAGGTPTEKDPLYQLTKGVSKAFLQIEGKAMIQWILDACVAAQSIENIVIIGLNNGDGLSCSKPLRFIPDKGNMFLNIQAGGIEILGDDKGDKKFFVISSDIPAISGEMLDWVADKTGNTFLDLYYLTIEKDVMEKQFPGSGRSFLKFKKRVLCGGDLAVLNTNLFLSEQGIWAKFTKARKNSFKLAFLVGFGFLVRFLLRTNTFDELVEIAGRRLNITGKAISCPFPEMGMDIDNIYQYNLMRNYLRERMK